LMIGPDTQKTLEISPSRSSLLQTHMFGEECNAMTITPRCYIACLYVRHHTYDKESTSTFDRFGKDSRHLRRARNTDNTSELT